MKPYCTALTLLEEANLNGVEFNKKRYIMKFSKDFVTSTALYRGSYN